LRIGQISGWFLRLPRLRPVRRAGLACFACALAPTATTQAQAPTEIVIHSFANFPHGASPYAPLARDAEGNFYGTTYEGGAANLGAVFRLNVSGYQVLYSFQGGPMGPTLTPG
jgi:uncharacterized repeat protein (TIGR03803 family)